MPSVFVDYEPRSLDRDAEPFVLRESDMSTGLRMTAVEVIELKREIAKALQQHANHFSHDD
jgi:hypothetical protein